MADEEDFSGGQLVRPMKSANPVEAQIVNHFSGLSELEETPEQLASELLTIRERLKQDEEREKKILGFFKSKKDRGMQNLGGILLEIKEEKGRTTVDWKQYILDQMGQGGVSEAEGKYGKTGAPIIKVSVKRFQ